MNETTAVESSAAPLPLRSLVASAMLERDELMTDEELDDGGFENCARHPDGAVWPAEVSVDDIAWFEVSPVIGSDDECDGYVCQYLFVRAQECVLLDISNPGYCDDESDGYLRSVSEVMTLAEAQVALQEQLDAYRATVEKHLASKADDYAKMFTKLASAEPA